MTWTTWRPTTTWTEPGAGDPLRVLRANARTCYSARRLDRLIDEHGPDARTNLRVIGWPLSEYSENRLGHITVGPR